MSKNSVLAIPPSRNPLRKNRRVLKNQVFGGVVILLAFSAIFSSGLIHLTHATTPAGSYFDHVVVIVMENEGIDNVCGSHPPPCNTANTPYMSALANNYTLGLQYTSVSCSGCPTSRPNYVALLSGSTQGCSSGGCPSPITAQNLVDRLESATLTWKGYFENQIINGQPFQGCDTNSNSEPYNPQHNPFVVFQDITTNSARCNNLIDANPTSCTVTDCALINDLNSASAPNFMWLTPNDCNDMHAASVCTNGCTSNSGQSSTCMQDGDKYLKGLVPNILKSNTFTTTRSALFITFDEGLTWCPQTGSSSEDCVYSVWAGPQAQNKFSSPSLYNHYSFTKTVETNWNLPSLTSNDANAKAMTEFFKTQPDFTISTNPSSVTFSSGGSGSFTAAVSAVNSFTGTVTLSTSTSPSGLSVGCNPTSITGGSGSSSCTLNSSNPGSYTATVTGTSGSLIHTATVSVTVTPPSTPDFTMAANPMSLTITQGSSATSTINLAGLNSFSGTITLSALVSPFGPSTSLNPSTVTLSSNGAGSSTLTVTTGSAPVGSYIVNVTGTGGSLSHSVTLTIAVNPPADFAISANPTSLTLGQGSSGSMTSVTVTTSGDQTWFESSYLSASFYAQGLTWLFFEDSSKTCEGIAGCLLYTTSSTASSWATPTNLGVHVTDSDFSVYSNGTNVYYVRYDELTFESTCGKNIQFRTGTLASSGTVNWQPEQTALAGSSRNTYPNDEIITDSSGQVWIAFLSDSHSACGGDGTDLPQIIHSSGTNYASWTLPLTLSTAHSNNWHIALVSLGSGQIFASYWLANADLHGKLYNGITWGNDEQISSSTAKNDVNAWLFNSGTSVYAIYFDNGPETFNFASRSSTGTWINNIIGAGESRTGTTFSSSYYSFPDAASYDPTHNQFYLFWMNATLLRIDQWKGAGSSWTKTTKIVGTTAVPYPDSITSFITSSPTNGFPTTGGIFYISGSSAPFTYNFVALPLSGSSTGTFTITITSQNGFAGTVNLSTSISPSTGLTVNCNPTSINSGSGSSTCTVIGSTAGNYNVTVTGTSGSLTHSTSVSVSVQTSSPDFTISSSPTSVIVNAGVTGSSTVTIAPLNSFSGTVTLTVTTNSTNLICALSSTSIAGGSGSSALSCHGSLAGNYLATVAGTSGSLSHSATVAYHVQDFSLTVNPTSVSVSTGTAGNSTLSVAPLNGFNAPVTLAVTTNSTNLVCTLSSTSIAGASGASNLSCTANISGDYLTTITGTGGTLSHSATVTYHVTVAPDFSVTANPTSVTASAGATGTSTIEVAPLNGFTGTVTLVVTTNSTNLICALSSTTIARGSGNSTLSCHASPAANYTATVTGSSGALSHSQTVTFHVQDFTLTASQTSVSTSVHLAGTSTITVAPVNGFTNVVTLALATNSTNLSCTLSTTSITGGSGTSTLSCTGSVAGNYLATATGTSNNLSHSTAVTFHVTGAADFSLSASPTNVSVNVETGTVSTITVDPLNGFTGNVTLDVTTNSTNLACTLNLTTITGGSGKSTLACNGSSAGNYRATVTGTSGSLSHAANVTYHVQDFAVTANPTSVSADVNVSGNSTMSVAPLNGFAGTVTLVVISNSTNLSCSLSSSSIPGGSGASTVSCTGSVAGNYLATITGSSGALAHSISITYNVTASQDFTLNVGPTNLTLNAGSAGNSTTTVAPINGFAGTVNVGATTNSTNLTCTISQTQVSGGSGNSTLSCTGSSAGNYLATIKATSGSLSHSATVTYHAQDFTISASPTVVNDNIGVAGNSTITVGPLNSFTGTIALVVTTNSSSLLCTLSASNINSGSGASTLSCTDSLPGSYLAIVTGANNGLFHAANVTYNVTIPVQDFAISANPTTLTVNVGFGGNSTITVSSENGFVGTVTLTVATNSSSTTCSLSSPTIIGGSGSSILSCSGSTAGNYLANVTGTSGSLAHSAMVTYRVQAFTVTANPSSVSTGVGTAGSSTISIAPISGFSSTVSLAVTTNSTILSCTLSSMSIPGGSGTSLLRCTGSTVGNYFANVTGTSGTIIHAMGVTFQVVANPDFGLTANPTIISVTTGSPGFSSITVAALNGFAGDVNLGMTTNSPNLSCSLSSKTISGGSGTSTLSCSSKITGNYVANITGTSGSLSHFATVAYQIGAAPDFTLSSNQASLTMTQGSSGVSIITLTSVNGFSGTVNISASASPLGPLTNLNPGTVTLSSNGVGTSSLNVTSASASPGAYKINVTATSGSLFHSFFLNVTITSTTVSPTYALVVSYEGFVYKLYANNTLTLIGQPVTTQLSAVAWKPDGSCAVIVGNAAVLIKWDGAKLTSIPTGVSSTINFISIAWRPDGSYALIGGSGGALLKYDCTSVTQISNPYAVSYRAVSWNPSGTQALLVSYFGKIYQYQSSTHQVTQLASPTSQSLDAVAWNPGGSYALLAGSGGAILRYDGTTFQLLNTAGVYSSSLTVRHISFNPTGSMALLVGDSGLVLTYNSSSLTALPTLTSSILYNVSWSAGTAFIVGGSGVMLTYSSSTLKSVPTETFSGFRGIAWKPN